MRVQYLVFCKNIDRPTFDTIDLLDVVPAYNVAVAEADDPTDTNPPTGANVRLLLMAVLLDGEPGRTYEFALTTTPPEETPHTIPLGPFEWRSDKGWEAFGWPIEFYAPPELAGVWDFTLVADGEPMETVPLIIRM